MGRILNERCGSDGSSGHVHLAIEPLHLIHNVQAAVNDKWIGLSCLAAESSNAITTLFGGAELELEERVVARADDAEVV